MDAEKSQVEWNGKRLEESMELTFAVLNYKAFNCIIVVFVQAIIRFFSFLFMSIWSSENDWLAWLTLGYYQEEIIQQRASIETKWNQCKQVLDHRWNF